MEQHQDDNKRKYKVYVYTNKINGKKYVGQTCRTLKERAGKNGRLYNQCKIFSYAIQKYGWDNFEPRIAFDMLTREEANRIERYLIKILRTQDHKYGYNIDAGGSDNTYNAINLTGMKFGRWTVIGLADTPPGAIGRHWLCQCDCGSTPRIIRQCNLTRGMSKSCGCLPREINSKLHINDFVKDQDKVTIFLNNNVKIIVDQTIYISKLCKTHLYYDSLNHRVLTSKDENIYRIIFPFINRSKIKYKQFIKHKNGNMFDFRKDNLEIIIPNNISENDFFDYLQDDTQGIIMSLSQINKWTVRKRIVDDKQHSFLSYNDAKDYITQNKEVA